MSGLAQRIKEQDEEWLTPEETAKEIRSKKGTLAVWRSTGRYRDVLPHHKRGGRIWYKKSDVESYKNSGRVQGVV